MQLGMFQHTGTSEILDRDNVGKNEEIQNIVSSERWSIL